MSVIEDMERLEQLEELVQELMQQSEEGAAIIVEGKRDRRALRELGITGPVKLGTQKSLLELCEEVAREYNKVIVLTDWDENGDKLARLMAEFLYNAGATVNTDIRQKIKALVKKRIKDIESLNTHIVNLRVELKTTTHNSI
ncbi:MAG: toprim domain-containing protein [ANME-2 cluster archaeon]|nr:toprim domain-containing protein [ANME-2 cluster archaeon]MDF1532404.1 toprim domain-containing protein [ANME-2 cluster archaeon]